MDQHLELIFSFFIFHFSFQTEKAFPVQPQEKPLYGRCVRLCIYLLQRSNKSVFFVLVHHLLFVAVFARFRVFYAYYDLYVVATRTNVGYTLSNFCVFGYLCHCINYLWNQIKAYCLSKQAQFVLNQQLFNFAVHRYFFQYRIEFLQFHTIR